MLKIKNVILSCLCGLLVGLTAFAVLCPKIKIKSYEPTGEKLLSILPNQALKTNDCSITSNKLSIEGNDPFLIFNGSSDEIRYANVSLLKPSKEDIVFQIFYTYDFDNDGFVEENSVQFVIMSGKTEGGTVIPKAAYTAYRLDSDSLDLFKQLDLYENEPTITENIVKISVWRYIAAAGITAFAVLLVLLCCNRWHWAEKLFSNFINNRLNLIFVVLGAFASAIIALFAEFLLARYICAPPTNGDFLNRYRLLFIFGTLYLAFFIILAWKRKFKLHNTFLIVTMIAGSIIYISSPFGHACWDIDSHYRWALNASFYKDVYLTESDDIITKARPGFTSFENLASNQESIAYMNDYGADYKCQRSSNDAPANMGSGVFIGKVPYETTVAHLPFGYCIALARMFGGSFFVRYTVGRFGGLIVYALVCYFAIRKLKSGKMILAVIALFPINLFLATQYSYDYWITCFSMLGMCCFIGEMQQPDKPIRISDSLIMCGAFFLAALPKVVYMPMLLIPFFIRKKNTQLQRRQFKWHYSVCTVAFLFLLIILAIKILLLSVKTPDYRGGADVSATGQILFILKNPFRYAVILFRSVLEFLSLKNASDYISFYAYLGCAPGATMFFITMLVTIITDHNEKDRFVSGNWLKFLAALFFFVMIVVIETALYVDFTPVGNEVINGCQRRYIIPLLFPLAIIIGCRKKAGMFEDNYHNYSMTIISICSSAICLSVGEQMLKYLK